MCAADLNYILVIIGFFIQRRMKMLQGRDQLMMDLLDR